MNIVIPNKVTQCTDIRDAERGLWVVLAAIHNKTSPSRHAIAKHLGISPNTLRKYLDALSDVGLVAFDADSAIRVEREDNSKYIAIPARIARDDRLSLRDIGALVRLASHHDSYRPTVKRMAYKGNGASVVRRSLNSLMDAGYVERTTQIYQEASSIRSRSHYHIDLKPDGSPEHDGLLFLS